MSVINKMLRDLDQREGGSALPASVQAPAADTRVVAGVASQRPVVSELNAPLPWRAVAIAVGLAVVGLGIWWWQKAPVTPAPSVASPVPTPMPMQKPQAPAAVSTPAPVPEVPAAAATIEPAKTAAAVVPQPAVAKPIAQKPEPVPVPTTVAIKSAPVAPGVVAPASHAVAPTPVAAAPTAAPIAVAAADAAGGAARQLQAGREALAQAQALFAAGSHDAATDLLQAAIGVLERATASSPSAAQTQLLAALARELGRIHLADGRPAATLEALTRMEPQLGREADIWAMRGNAAQRLGKHQDSVNAYATALQLRPNEQRWLLASAVSLAALGQTAGASDMAEKAKALGPISKDVQTYLRQAGVRIGEP